MFFTCFERIYPLFLLFFIVSYKDFQIVTTNVVYRVYQTICISYQQINTLLGFSLNILFGIFF